MIIQNKGEAMNSSLSKQNMLWEETVPGGAHWSFLMKRGTALRITDIEGGANLSALFYNREEKLERYNMADTLKAQHTAHLTKGFVCYSDMGRVLASIIEDSCGWHDTISGMSNAVLVENKYGKTDYQQYRNAMHRNARDSFLIELGKWGLGKRDIVPNINFFSKVSADESGNLHYASNHSKAGTFVDVRFDMDVLVVVSACQHPLDPEPQYAPKPVQLQAWRCGTAEENDYCRNFRPENARGFHNTDLLYR
jgi:urea carboxylase-associated protein 2